MISYALWQFTLISESYVYDNEKFIWEIDQLQQIMKERAKTAHTNP